jgi:hypothetical protein
MSSNITVEQISQVASLNEPVLRNLQITQCYCELSAAFAKRMDGYANWCTFATWASKQAGQTIRQEDLQRTIESFLENEPTIEVPLSLIAKLAKQKGAQKTFDELRKTTLGIVAASIVNHASDAISRANKKVFKEIAYQFALFMSGCFNDVAFLQSNMDEFCKQLQTGSPPEGQDYLRKAFCNYYQALFENDADKKTELIFLANLQVGFHEQNRLQPEIAESLDSFIDVPALKSKLFSSLFSGSDFWTRIQLFFQRLFGKTLLDQTIGSLLENIRHPVRTLLTAQFMTITLPPDNRLHLGKDLTVQYPGDLQQLTNVDLLALLKQIDPTLNSVDQSGATDWANLRERMHFIADLFRCYHESKELFEPAFSVEQVEQLKNGKLPGGKL